MKSCRHNAAAATRKKKKYFRQQFVTSQKNQKVPGVVPPTPQDEMESPRERTLPPTQHESIMFTSTYFRSPTISTQQRKAVYLTATSTILLA